MLPTEGEVDNREDLIIEEDTESQMETVDEEEVDHVHSPEQIQCPVAQVDTSEVNSFPLDILTLNGSLSSDPNDPNGVPVSYHWSVLQRPAGSTAQIVERLFDSNHPAEGGLEDDPTTPTAQFFVDLAGEYRIALTVTNSAGYPTITVHFNTQMYCVRPDRRTETLKTN